MGFLATLPIPEGMGRVTFDYTTNTARLVHASGGRLESVPINVSPDLRRALGGAPYLDVRLGDDVISFALPVPARGHLGNPYGVYSALRHAQDAQGAPETWRTVVQRIKG